VFVLPLIVVESRCPCRDVGEAILVGSLRPIRTARKTLGGRTLERPSCGLRADRGDNTAPGIQCHIENIVDEQRAIRQRTQCAPGDRQGVEGESPSQ
jgi:hypothetical protein